MVRDLCSPRRLVALEPGRVHPERVEDELAIYPVELLAGHLLNEDPGDHVASVGVPEAPSGRKAWLSVGGRVIHELDRTPRAPRLPAKLRGEHLVAEVVVQAGGMREQLTRRGVREGVQRPPAVNQSAVKLVAERPVERQPSVAGEPERDDGRDPLCEARRTEGIV